MFCIAKKVPIPDQHHYYFYNLLSSFCWVTELLISLIDRLMMNAWMNHWWIVDEYRFAQFVIDHHQEMIYIESWIFTTTCQRKSEKAWITWMVRYVKTRSMQTGKPSPARCLVIGELSRSLIDDSQEVRGRDLVGGGTRSLRWKRGHWMNSGCGQATISIFSFNPLTLGAAN